MNGECDDESDRCICEAGFAGKKDHYTYLPLFYILTLLTGPGVFFDPGGT